MLLGGSGADGILNDVSEGGVALDIVGSQAPGEYVDVDFEMPGAGGGTLKPRGASRGETSPRTKLA